MGIYDVLKDAVKVARQVDNIDLAQTLMDVQQAALDQQAEVQLLRERVKELEAELALTESLEFDGKAYLLRRDPDDPAKLCPKCWDVDRKQVRVPPTMSKGLLMCPSCDTLADYRR